MDGVLYQGNSIASKRKKREDETKHDDEDNSEDETSGIRQEQLLEN